jgi:hypothetical protein
MQRLIGLNVRQLSQRCVTSRAMSSAAENYALVYTRGSTPADVDGSRHRHHQQQQSLT